MNKIDVLLINLPTTSWYKKKFATSNSMPPLGLLYIATVLKNNKFKVKLIDFAVEHFSKEDFEKEIKALSPKIIGLSTYNESWKAQKILCNIIKNMLPEVKIFAGGAFSTFCYKDVLMKSQTDYIIKGEGEFSVLKLCNKIIKKYKIELKDIPGIIYRKKDRDFFINDTFTRIANLDSLPFIDRDLINLNKYLVPFTISTSRGCPGQCIFCSSKAFWGKKVYMRSAQNVFDELLYLYEKYNTTIFYITDDTFTASTKRIYEFCKLIKESKINFIWGCESRADVITENLMKVLYDAGCRKIQIGLESADDNILKNLKKNVTIKQIEHGIKLAHKNGMHVSASFIIGHAFDTEETINKTLGFVKYIQKSYGAYVMGSINTPFPGTEQYEKKEELNINIFAHEWDDYKLNSPMISTKNLSLSKLRWYFNIVTEIMNNNGSAYMLKNGSEN